MPYACRAAHKDVVDLVTMAEKSSRTSKIFNIIGNSALISRHVGDGADVLEKRENGGGLIPAQNAMFHGTISF